MEPYKHEMTMGDYSQISDIIEEMMAVFDEYDGAKHYIKEAIRLKMTDKTRAESNVAMSAQELSHGDTHSATVGKLLEKAKADGNECYATLAMVWHHLKKRQDGYAAWIRQMHEQYKK